MNRLAKIGSFAALGLVLAAAAPAPQPPAPPAVGPPGKAPAADTLEVLYAKTQVRLAETNLKWVQRANERVGGAVPGNTVAEYQEDLAVARARLQAASEGAGPMVLWLRGAEAVARSADREWRSAVAANLRMAGAVDELEVERLRLRAELARLRIERGKAVTGKSPQAQLEWEVGVLGDEVDRLKEEVLRNPPVPRSYPLFRY